MCVWSRPLPRLPLRHVSPFVEEVDNPFHALIQLLPGRAFLRKRLGHLLGQRSETDLHLVGRQQLLQLPHDARRQRSKIVGEMGVRLGRQGVELLRPPDSPSPLCLRDRDQIVTQQDIEMIPDRDLGHVQ